MNSNKRRVSDLFVEENLPNKRYYKVIEELIEENDEGYDEESFEIHKIKEQKEFIERMNDGYDDSINKSQDDEPLNNELKKIRFSFSDDYSQEAFGQVGDSDDYPDNGFGELLGGNHVLEFGDNEIQCIGKMKAVQYNTIDFKQFIGKGNFSDVWSARIEIEDDEEADDSLVAVKILKNNLKSGIDNNKVSIEALMLELDIIRKVNEDGNEHVLRLIGFCNSPQACILTELMEFTLYDLIHQQPKSLHLDQLKIQISIALQISKGIYGINEHSQILHNDLTSKNILLRSFVNSRNETDFVVKISDFGLSSFIDSSFPTKRGNARWRSPEQTLSNLFSKKGEVWSFGVIFWEILTQQLPYSHIKDSKMVAQMVASKTLSLEIPSSLNPILFDLLNDCLIYDHEKRTSITNIVSVLSKYHDINFQDI